MKKKKLTAWCLLIALCLGFSSCGGCFGRNPGGNQGELSYKVGETYGFGHRHVHGKRLGYSRDL
ncbi:MAG: hypothetical protein MJ078_02475 [Clostridia bacterium]|nr:hypothetical protein [Clostridia bacterium]